MLWSRIPISLNELCIDTTLRCGQSFRWKKSSDGQIFSCAFRGRLISLRQDLRYLYYSVTRVEECSPHGISVSRRSDTSQGDGTDHNDDVEAFICHYFNLGPNLGKLYEHWSAMDPNFKEKAPKFTGVRILRQDAWEALVGFICSSNNNIARITQMVEKLCVNYGNLVGHFDNENFYDMPPPSVLVDKKVENHLRELGFGYRAKYLHETALTISNESEDWLDNLRNPESPLLDQKWKNAGAFETSGRAGYREAHEKLLKLQGVGPKVADCVCLMGLGWSEAVPVDTHVWQIAQRDYKFGKGKHRSLTKITYDAVADHFRGLWGKEAGWAHSVLFTADLRAFSDRLTSRTVADAVRSDAVNQEIFTAKVEVEVAPTLVDLHEKSTSGPSVKAESQIKLEGTMLSSESTLKDVIEPRQIPDEESDQVGKKKSEQHKADFRKITDNITLTRRSSRRFVRRVADTLISKEFPFTLGVKRESPSLAENPEDTNTTTSSRNSSKRKRGC